jgi:hypothetical protein
MDALLAAFSDNVIALSADADANLLIRPVLVCSFLNRIDALLAAISDNVVALSADAYANLTVRLDSFISSNISHNIS